MKEKWKCATAAFLLTLILLGSGISILLAYDRMDREMYGIAQARSGEIVIGSHSAAFDLSESRAVCECIRELIGWVGGIPFAWFETLFYCADSAANSLHQAAFAGEFDFS